jgi:hypothetical protein
MQKYNLPKNPSREYNSITNLKFPTQAKISSFKNPHTKKTYYYLGAKIPEATILYYNESKHNLVCLCRQDQQTPHTQSHDKGTHTLTPTSPHPTLSHHLLHISCGHLSPPIPSPPPSLSRSLSPQFSGCTILL